MDWGSIGSVLDRYQDADGDGVPDSIDSDFDQVAAAVPAPVLADGVAEAFRSDRTPEFPQMASQLFGRASGSQRASILGVLLQTLGPLVLQQVLARRNAGSGGGGGLGDVLGNVLGRKKAEVTPAEAEKVDPAAVEDLAREAEKRDPSIVDKLSRVTAAHPQLLKTLGQAALAIVMGKMVMAQRQGRV